MSEKEYRIFIDAILFFCIKKAPRLPKQGVFLCFRLISNRSIDNVVQRFTLQITH